MADQPARIVIVDDHKLLAGALVAWINRNTDMQVAGVAEDGEAGCRLCRDLQPDLVLVDIDLPKMNGLELVDLLSVELPSVRLLTMTGRMDPYTIWRVSQSGAHGYVEKSMPPEALIQAVRTVLAGGTYFSPLFQQVKQDWLYQPEAFPKILSDREQEVLLRVAAGWDDERIAARLKISVATVAVHRKNVRQKLELHNDRELVAYARHWGLDKAIGDLEAERL